MNNRIPPIPMMLHIIGNIPTSYAMGMSYEEQLLCLKNYLCKMVVPTMNKNIEEIQTLITYINNYFNNLDVQDEINNKIDEMVESGELQEIITSYLQVNGVLAFNTLNEMLNSTNIMSGSTCRTLGLNSFNDGKGELYKIREITNQDEIDGVNIIAIPSSQTLIAELITNYYMNEIKEEINSINNDLNIIKNKKYLFIGDSYAVGYMPGSTDITGFYDIIKNTLNLNATIICKNGYGFLGNSNNKKWIDLIRNSEIDDKSSYTDIFICGGMNDSAVEENIIPAINECINYIKANFINATIHIGMIGKYAYTNDQNELIRLINLYEIYKNNALLNKCKYINNSEILLHKVDWFHTDQKHPNVNGQNALANGLIEYILNNNINVVHKYSYANIQASTNIDLSEFYMYTFMENNTCRVLFTGNIKFNTGVQIKNITSINLGKITSGYIKGSPQSQGISCTFETYIYDNSSNSYKNVRMNLRNTSSNDLILTPFTIKQTGGSETIENVTLIGIAEGNASDTIPSLYC